MRYFPDKLPIGMQPHADTHVFVYLVTRPSPMDFRLFLLRHAALLRVLFRWTVRLLLPRQLCEGQTGLPARRPGAPRDAAAPVGRRDVGVAVPRTEAARRTGRRACRRTLPESLQRLPHAAVSSAVPTVAGRARRTPSGWPARPSWPTPSTATTDGSSASSSRGSTCISLPWLTSPDTNSRGRPGGRPPKSRLSPRVASETIPPAVHHASDGLPASTADNRFAGRTFHRERARRQHDGRRSLPPTAQAPVPRSEQETMA